MGKRKNILYFLIVFILALLFGARVINYEKPTPPSPVPEEFLLNSPTALSQTYYVDTKGNDGNNGSQSFPYKTIQRAINQVPSGSTIIVVSGDYPERPVIIATKNNITLQAQGKVKVRGFHITRNVGTIIDGFDISATSSTYVEGWGIWVQGNDCAIRNNVIHDVSWGGILMMYYSNRCVVENNKLTSNISLIGIDIRGNNHIVSGNEIADVRQYSPLLSNSPGFDADGIHFHGSGHVISNNYIHDIPYNSYNPTSHTDCFQTFDGSTEQPKAVNVTIENNRCENIGWVTNEILTKGIQAQSAQNLVIKNNTLCAAAGIS